MPDGRIEQYLHAVEMEIARMPEQRRDEELQEVRQHLINLVEEYRTRGFDDDEAIDTALARFGEAAMVGNDLRDVWESRQARILRPNRLLLVSLGTATVGIAMAYMTFFNRLHEVRNFASIGVNGLTLLFYLAIVLAALAAAMISRSWAVAALVPVAMLATWITVDLTYGHDTYVRWGLTYLNQRGMEYDLLAGTLIRAIQLMPAAAGAALGGFIGSWMFYTDRTFSIPTPSRKAG